MRAADVCRSALLAVVALFGNAIARGAGAQTGVLTGDAAARIVVSKTEARVALPVDSSTAALLFALADSAKSARPTWAVFVAGIDGPTLLIANGPLERVVGVNRDQPSAKLTFSRARFFIEATDLTRVGAVAATFDGRSVNMLLRDSALIASAFGLRPSGALIMPALGAAPNTDSVFIDYVDPQIPVPSPALLERGRRGDLLAERRSTRLFRQIEVIGEDNVDPIWLTIGNTIPLDVVDSKCRFDMCGEDIAYPGGGTWLASNSIVRIVRTIGVTHTNDGRIFGVRGNERLIIADAVGRTTVRVSNIDLAIDADRAGNSVPSTVQRDIIVTRPITRLAISPRPATAQVGDSIRFVAHAINDRGEEEPDVLATLEAVVNTSSKRFSGPRMLPLSVDAIGKLTVYASLGKLRDSVVVRVRAPK